jgi:hypothetical protein
MKPNLKLYIALFLMATAFGLKSSAQDSSCPVCPYSGNVKSTDIKESVEVLHQYALNCQRAETAQEKTGNKALRDRFDHLKIAWGSYENLKMNNVDAFYAAQAQHRADLQRYQHDLQQYNCTYRHTDCPAGAQ